MFKDNNAINKNQIEEEIDRILPEYAINTLFFDGEDIRDTCKEVLNIDGRQENEITTIPILYDNNNDIVTTSTSKYSKPALDDDFIKEFDTWLNSNEVRRKYQ